ncbi:calumenin-B-like [Petromyzon marinus]|uniref:calumenin-B-like n=1 Tax=Petromyzon marinus TaxID=7757 RepID=UPI003F725558
MTATTATTPPRWVPALLTLLLATANLATAKPTADEKPRHAGTRGGVDGARDDARPFGSDHDAILGSYAAREFRSLSPEESKERLGKIVDRMDVDGDGLVGQEELAAWIRQTQRRWLREDVEQRWRDPNGDGRLSWDEYRNATYGGLSFETADAYSRLLARDKRRFDAAAGGVSGGAAAGGVELSRGEFAAFLHPSSFGHMSDIVVTETIEDVDKDGDGVIDLEEYIADMYHPAGPAETTEPEWVETERQQFRRFRDSDGDGRMGREEVRAWLLPVGYEHALAEARHLVGEADDGDEDGKLSKEEILAKWSVFVGSQATNYGDDLNRRHEEL